jgi:hypothetical protein
MTIQLSIPSVVSGWPGGKVRKSLFIITGIEASQARAEVLGKFIKAGIGKVTVGEGYVQLTFSLRLLVL